MAEKIVFFSAGSIPTTDEKTEIANLNKLIEPKYKVLVRNRLVPSLIGDTDADFVAGTPPSGEPWDSIPEFTGDASEGFAPVVDGQEIAGTGGTFTVTVVNGEITGGTWTPD